MKYDYLIVGSGLYGATFAYLAKKQGKTGIFPLTLSSFGDIIFKNS